MIFPLSFLSSLFLYLFFYIPKIINYFLIIYLIQKILRFPWRHWFFWAKISILMIKVWSKRKSMTTYCWMITAILGPSVCTSAESSTAHSRFIVSWNNRKSLSNIWQCFLLDIYWWNDCKNMLVRDHPCTVGLTQWNLRK